MPQDDLETRSVSRVARGGLAAFIIYGAGVGLAYCSQLLIARLVGVDAYGLYAYVMAWVTVLAYFSALGFDVALLRFLPAYEAACAWPLFRGVIRYAERRAMAVSAAIILAGAYVVLAREVSTQLRDTFLIGLLLVPVLALLWIRSSIVRACGGVLWAVAPNRVMRDGVLVGLVALASAGLGWTLDAAAVISATLVGAIIALLFATLGMRKLRPRIIDGVEPAYEAESWRRAALPLVILTAAEALLNRSGVIVLGWFGDTKAAGIYSLAFNIAFVVGLPRVAINTLFAPTISGFHARNEHAMLQRLITRAASWTLAASGFIGIVLFVFAEQFFGWFGADYAAGVPALRILLVGQVLVAAGGSQLHVMTMTGHERSAAVLLVSSTIVNLAASGALVALIGLNGAAIGTAATLILWNLAMATFLSRRLGLKAGVLAFLQLGLKRTERQAAEAPPSVRRALGRLRQSFRV
ncbi:Exopolysaccharide biosynthesis protein [Bosea sp. LC85]|uniref:oligosaccharide flippase family protein n=1 Tax=Bosea sp. LC85 TaxID=1502851 RepID=UPI0004E2F84E|nr:oligosaccharide flippase family protein [Bosea sp. LC85]KFC70978.1 Exopolysaccharide biosynthesis protein [Bosea sp. LC85]